VNCRYQALELCDPGSHPTQNCITVNKVEVRDEDVLAPSRMSLAHRPFQPTRQSGEPTRNGLELGVLSYQER
jgi:hypothetical protein